MWSINSTGNVESIIAWTPEWVLNYDSYDYNIHRLSASGINHKTALPNTYVQLHFYVGDRVH